MRCPAQGPVEVREQGTDGTDWQPIADRAVHFASCRKRDDDFQGYFFAYGWAPGIAADASTLLCGYRRPVVSEFKERLPAISQPALTPRVRDPENPVLWIKLQFELSVARTVVDAACGLIPMAGRHPMHRASHARPLRVIRGQNCAQPVPQTGLETRQRLPSVNVVRIPPAVFGFPQP